MNKNKNILIITYYFPPAGGPGVQRVLKFIKYLPEYGWNPVVITVKNGDFPAKDPSLFSDVPDDVPVYRVPAAEPYTFYRKLTGKKEDEEIPVGVLAKEGDPSLLNKMAKWIRANIFIPDARIGWILPVYKKAVELIDKYDIQAVFSSSPPHSLQLSAKFIKNKFNIPWICDLRDPWTEIYYYQHLNRLNISNRLDKKLEKSVLKSADSVSTVSPQLIEQFKSVSNRNNFIFIPNGYDSTDMKTVDAGKSSNFFTLSYIGNFKSNQNISALWIVINELIQNNQSFAKYFRLKLTGKIHPDVLESIEEYELAPYLITEDYVPHSVATQRMQESSVLLFPIPQAPDNHGILTGKIFEYLASGTPLLSIGPPQGDAAEIIAEVEGGPMFDYDNKKGIKSYIKKLFQYWRNDSLSFYSPDPDKINKYNRQELTKKLSDHLNMLTKE